MDMITVFVGMIIMGLVMLAILDVVFIDVYKILKLANHETDVDVIKFDKCVLPYRPEKIIVNYEMVEVKG